MNVLLTLVKSCVALYSAHLLAYGHPTSDQTHCTLRGLEPSYESTYQEVHKANFQQLHGLVQTPELDTFMHTDLTWATQILPKGGGTILGPMLQFHSVYIMGNNA